METHENQEESVNPELDLFQPQDWKDPADARLHRRMLEKERTYDFLAGLNPTLDEVRGIILGVKPLQSLDEIFAEVCREEHRKSVMLSPNAPSPVDSSAMAARAGDEKGKKPTTWCDHCYKPYHTKSKCWKLHGKPAGWVPKHMCGSSGHTASTQSAMALPPPALFTDAQLDQLSKFFSSTPTASLMASIGNPLNSTSAPSKAPWIIDSGASDHMTGSKMFFTTYSPSIFPRTVKIADGSFLLIHGTGLVSVGPSLCLKNVLYVPGFSCNLLSTMDQNCNAIFSPSRCFFQDQRSGRVIGNAEESSGLYYFQQAFYPINQLPGGIISVANFWENAADHDIFWASNHSPTVDWEFLLKDVQEPDPSISAPNPPNITQQIPQNQPPEISQRLPSNPIGTTKIQPYDRFYERRKNLQQIEEPATSHDQAQLPVPGKDLTISEIDIPIALRKGKRSCTNHPISDFLGYAHLSQAMQALVETSYFNEIQALEKNETWTIVQKPQDKKSVGCKWVFTIKYNSDGTVERHKARLVAKGYTKLKNVFLNGELEEEVYMDLPPGFNTSNNQGNSCRLKKSLYGLKQSPRAWFGRFMKFVQSQGFKQAQVDHTLFYKRQSIGITILIVYVDDIVLTGDAKLEMQRIKAELAREFDMKDLGNLRFFLGMEIARNKDSISMSQRKYTLDLLKETGMLGSKLVDTPMDANLKLISNRSTIYVRILFFCLGNLVTWRSKKQIVVARSSAEAELRSVALGTCEGLWIKMFLKELELEAIGPILEFCDNSATISIIRNPVHHDKIKHVEVDRHFIKEKIDQGILTVKHISTKNRLLTS
ncbi:uncharacterized protein [Primulina eburnea]|uniref:uncharacterized protein n=1 Tax=Primulina eburnea TaxID=1245227 RepID=UPI003C6CBCA2